MDFEREIRKLKTWNRIFVSCLVLAVCAWLLSFFLVSTQLFMRELKYSRNGNSLRVGSSTDGPYLVTHVAWYDVDTGDKRWAALPNAVLIVDSWGAEIDLSSLKWMDYHGQPAEKPEDYGRLEVIYFVPSRALEREPFKN